jgi:YYY domain-containing protein
VKIGDIPVTDYVDADENHITPPPRRPLIRITMSDMIVAMLLFLTVLAGGYARFMANNWDDFVRFHPDERYLTMIIAPSLGRQLYVNCPTDNTGYNPCHPDDQVRYERQQMCLQRYPDSNGAGDFFDTACSLLNPENIDRSFYVYGTLPLFMARFGAEVMYSQTNELAWLGSDGIVAVWRAQSALAETLVILLVFLMGLRLHGKWVGLLASILYAATVFSIQQAHFGTTDATTNFFVALALYFAVRTQGSGKWWDYVGFGIGLGAAVASRVNVAPLAGVIIVVAIYRMLPSFDSRLNVRERSNIAMTQFLYLVLAGIVSIFVFRIGNPYAFEGPGFFGIIPSERYIKTLGQAQFYVGGEYESPPNWQWVNRAGYLFPLSNMVLWGMGVALGVTAWLSLIWSLWRLIRGKAGAHHNLALSAWVVAYFLFVGNLWVMSMRYYLPLYPALVVLAAWGLVELLKRSSAKNVRLWRTLVAAGVLVGVTSFTVLWAVMFTNIYREPATFVQATYYAMERVPADFWMQRAGADADEPLINISFPNEYKDSRGVPFEQWIPNDATRFYPNLPSTARFRTAYDGIITTVTATRLMALDSSQVHALRLSVFDPITGDELTTATIRSNFVRPENTLGETYPITFETPLQVKAGAEYLFRVEVLEGDIVLSIGSVMGSEQPWDEPVPNAVCQLPLGTTLADDLSAGMFTRETCQRVSIWGDQIHVHNLDIASEDTDLKRERWITMLDQSDYLYINTNRRYDSHSRLPVRFPLTNRYYEALFSGELGFELVATFQETFELGPLKISDQYLPNYNAPSWLNEYEAEEAFTVYDHPVVFLFKKRPDYSSEQMRGVMNGVVLTRTDVVVGGYVDPTLVNITTVSSLQADKAPSNLMLTPEMRQIQQSGGTWSERFNPDSFINSNQLVTIAVWWLTIMVFGFIMFPILFAFFPALADRGYGFSKIIGIALTAWIAWALGTLRFLTWSSAGLLVILAILATFSLWVMWRVRASFFPYIRARWKMLIWMDILAFVLFLAFVGVRLSNPDLWHNAFGGEKPMDFAYFNAVLRSTIFPAYDPWLSGGYLNYYYFGFVIAGVPTLLLGVVPSVAYNLIIPMLFSVTGMGAFSVAFNVVSSWKVTEKTYDEHGQLVPVMQDDKPKRRPLGNPWVAGIMALLMAVVFGNLDTGRVFLTGVAQAGGWKQPQGMFVDELEQDFFDAYGVYPNKLQTCIDAEALRNKAPITDQIAYEIGNIGSLFSAIPNGFLSALSGGQIFIGTDRWFWAPTRTITEIPCQGDGAINEMPYFTFVYGDLHAHMISMPLMLFTMLFVFAEIMHAGRDKRAWWMGFGAVFLGAMVVGLFTATNTWETPTFTIFSVLGLGYAWWLRWETISRWSLWNLLLRVGGFLIIMTLVALPFTWWFASSLTEFKLWDGRKTPLWAYLSIHGLFIFVIVSLLVWESARWMRSVRVKTLRGKINIIITILLGLAMVFFGTLAVVFIGYHVAMVVIPLVVWIGVLFFRPNQSRAMQFILVLAGLALAITLGTEILTLRFDNGRQNSIFKFYIQVWLIFSVVGGAGFAWITSYANRWKTRLALPWYSIMGVMIFVCLMFPITATGAKAVFRLSMDVPLTLDGNDYLNYVSYWEEGLTDYVEFRHDYDAIDWLQRNVIGSPVIIEAQSFNPLYRWGGRISINTGLPSVAGWDYHQKQQRSLGSMPQIVSQRAANVNAFYSTLDINVASNILRFYNVKYVIVTDYEMKRYINTGGLVKFNEMVERGLLTVAYQNELTTIYETNQDALYELFVKNMSETIAIP